jgi:DNA primase
MSPPNGVQAKPVATPGKLVRSAISLLLQQPARALELQQPFRLAGLRQPGVALLIDLLQRAEQRPDISTGSLVEHFSGRDEYAALQKLASQSRPGDESAWRSEFIDAVMQLERQTLQQRLDELQAKQRESGLDDADKVELRALLQSRFA